MVHIAVISIKLFQYWRVQECNLRFISQKIQGANTVLLKSLHIIRRKNLKVRVFFEDEIASAQF